MFLLQEKVEKEVRRSWAAGFLATRVRDPHYLQECISCQFLICRYYWLLGNTFWEGKIFISQARVQLKTVFRIRIAFSKDPEPAFYINSEPDPRPTRIHAEWNGLCRHSKLFFISSAK
jgi:hypothetical protein